MLKYIHQFVQSFLREASKPRPKSRKLSRSSVDLTKEKSTVRPEIFAIDFNREGQEAERSKEILELKRTYRLLMKKFVNPKLDLLMANSKKASDVNFMKLKEKQELISSVLSKLFYEGIQQKKPVEGPTKEISEHIVDELSTGWYGQRTSRLAANPMVETASYTNNIASALFEFPETKIKPGSKTIGQPGKLLKQRIESITSKIETDKTKEKNDSSSKNVAGSHLRMELNPEIDKKSNRLKERKDLTQYNQKKNNINIIRSIAKIDKGTAVKPDSISSKKKTNVGIKNQVASERLTGQKKVTSDIKKQQKVGKSVNTSEEKSKLGSSVLKKKNVTNDKNLAEKNEQSKNYPLNAMDVSLEAMPNKPKPSPVDTKVTEPTNKTVNTPSEKVELGISKNITSQEINNETEVSAVINVSRSNLKVLKNEQCQTPSYEMKNEESDFKESLSLNNTEHAINNVEKITNQNVNGNPKSSDNTYWDMISNKLIKTRNDAQKFINNIDIGDWKVKNFGNLGTDTDTVLTKDFTKSDLGNKQNPSEPNTENSKKNQTENYQNSTDIIDFKAKTYIKPEFDDTNVHTIKPTVVQTTVSPNEPSVKANVKMNSSQKNLNESKKEDFFEQPVENNQTRSTDFNSINTAINSIKGTANGECNNVDTCSDAAYISYSEGKEKELKNSFKSKEQVQKSKSPASKLSEVSSTVNVGNIIPEQNSKIKKLLKRFERMQKSKSNQNVGTVKKILNKITNDGKFKNMPLHKFKAKNDKNLIHKIRKAVRTKSNNLKGKIHSRTSMALGSRTDIFRTKENEINVNNHKLPISVNKRPKEPPKAIKVNRVKSDIFPNASRNIAKGTLTPAKHSLQGNERTTKRRSRKTEFDLSKARKLHSRKEFVKPTILQMYGTKRSIYTLSNPEAILPQAVFKSYSNENFTEPNIVSGSLMKVCLLKPIVKQSTLHPPTTHVRNLHTIRFKGKGKQLPRKKLTTIIKGCGETKSVKSISDSTVDMSKPIEVKLERHYHPSKAKTVDRAELSFKQEVPTENPGIYVKLNCNHQSEKTESNGNNPNKGNSRLLLSSSVKGSTVAHIETVQNGLEQSGVHEVSNTKASTLQESASSQKSEQVNGKSSEPALNEVVMDSPRWKSKKDRLEKWKEEVESDCTEVDIKVNDVDIKTKENIDNHSDITQTKGAGKSDVAFEKIDPEDSSVCPAIKGKIQLTVSPNEKMEKSSFQKDDKDYTVGDKEKKNLCQESIQNMLPFTRKNNSVHRKNENTTVQNEATGKVGQGKKPDLSNCKIREFESKLRALESKLKNLELKSTEKGQINPLSKKNLQQDKGTVVPPPEGNKVSIDKNKNDIKLNTNLEFIRAKSIHNKNSKVDHIKEQLTMKVKNLELKLISLETKLENLKERPTGLADNKERNQVSLLSKPSQDNIKSKSPLKKKIINEKKTSPYNGKEGYLNQTKDCNSQIKEECGENKNIYAKSEDYLKHYLASDKNSFKENVLYKHVSNVTDGKVHRSPSSIKFQPRSITILKDLKPKAQNAKSTNGLPTDISKQKLQTKGAKLSGVEEAKKEAESNTNKAGKQLNKNSDVKITVAPTVYGKITENKKINKDENTVNKDLNRNNSRHNFHWASDIGNKTELNMKTNKQRNLQTFSSLTNIPQTRSGATKASLGSKNSSHKVSNDGDNSEIKKIITPLKNSFKKTLSYSVERKRPLIRKNSKQLTKKEHSSQVSVVPVQRKRNSLHEGLLDSTAGLKPLSSEQGDKKVINKVNSITKTQCLTKGIIHKPLAPPRKITKAPSNLKSTPEKQYLKNVHMGFVNNIDKPAGFSKSATDSKIDKCHKNEMEEKKFNSFDYYRPKKRTYIVKHPIENENNSITFPEGENIVEKFYPKHSSKNSSLCPVQYLENNQTRKESSKFLEENDKHFNFLMTRKNPIAIKSIRK